ncbi:hypothetical protein BX659_10615 [Orenia metallireducens]|jgi:hypothetical protein|uniref:Coat F domain-containing protein n=1 Tax=Orenia metallireducens TaxID=1413210 RepID=A0A285HUJ1_9FIRM|nr:hypothetical protein [Orenia metallireducens]PRX30983.1 hypothetical protein BX659_10615 [Orenia metallireducens]SNY39374.1 hypothetical protein SAMN06265827_12515 [Orenia metallireducens]
MEQLTQMELIQLQSHLDSTALAMKKCQVYQEQAQAEELKSIFQDAAQVYEEHLQTLLNQLREFNGKKH